MTIEMFALLWVLCGLLSYGYGFAYLQRHFPTIAELHYYEDMKFSLLMSLLGPFNLLAVIVKGLCKHGFKLK